MHVWYFSNQNIFKILFKYRYKYTFPSLKKNKIIKYLIKKKLVLNLNYYYNKQYTGTFIYLRKRLLCHNIIEFLES